MAEHRRGFVQTDEKEFSKEGIALLRRAQQDILYLLEQGYPIKSASTFVGNHYMLSERQRLAIVRATATKETIELRKGKRLSMAAVGNHIYVDGLNVIITLEVALSNSTLIHCMDGTIRDLAGLRGTYRIIDKTTKAIQFLGEELCRLNAEEVTIYLDAPVSNTGRLKTLLLELLKSYPFLVSVELVNNADSILEKLENVVTQDAIILNRCKSWINLTAEVILTKLHEVSLIELN